MKRFTLEDVAKLPARNQDEVAKALGYVEEPRKRGKTLAVAKALSSHEPSESPSLPDPYRVPRSPYRIPKGAKPERPVRHEPVGEGGREEGDAPRFRIVVKSYRCRLLDPDNLAGGCKFLIDCCRYAGLVPGDSPQEIELTTQQEKVASKDLERTEILVARIE